MIREFTRIEFENDAAVVVSTSKQGSGHLIKGNQASGVKSVIDFKGIKHEDAVNEVIARFGKAARRKLNHEVKA